MKPPCEATRPMRRRSGSAGCCPATPRISQLGSKQMQADDELYIIRASQAKRRTKI